MGGHGGLNILPQKRWNVYNFDNREKVRKDEEAAAKEEQLKREQSRKRDTEFRLEQLRQARGLASSSRQAQSTAVSGSVEPESDSKVEPESEPKSRHMNLFEGIRIFDPIEVKKKDKGEFGEENRKGFKRMKKEAEAPKVNLPEDEKYRLGYGVAGKGVKLPWYMEKRANDDSNGDDAVKDEGNCERGSRSSGKKSLEELREERLKRERAEKERQRALLLQKGGRRGSDQSDRGFSRSFR